MTAPNTIDALYAEAFGLHSAGKLAKARALYERIISLDGGRPEVFFNHAMTSHGLGNLTAALESYEKTLALAPDFVPAIVNRADALLALDRLDNAAAAYGDAIARDPGNPAPYANRSLTLQKLGRFEEAESDCRKALALQPDHPRALKSSFWLALGGLSESKLIEQRLSQTVPLAIREEKASLLARKSMLSFHIEHDMEQTAYLIREGYGSDGLREAHDAYRAAVERMGGDSGETAKAVPLSDAEVAAINRFRAKVLRPDLAPMEHYLHPDTDWRRIEEEYLDSKPEIVVIDNFLSPLALSEMRKFCLVSTVYKTDYAKQYLGAFADAGFLSPLHISIARALQEKMPRIFAGHRLEQMWSFKYTAKMRAGLNVHADFARVNLNFWVTPDEAVIDTTTGGLIVHDIPAPATWTFRDYNSSDDARIYGFLRSHNAGARKIPYRCNRAVLFNSLLFHETDAIHFKPGYENRRVNITYLFGQGLAP